MSTTTSMLNDLSPNAEVVSKQYALKVNCSAAVGLQNVLKSNLGPTGTLKLLVGGAGQLKLTKDGLTLLKEMQIQHPTAALIARTATAQDEVTGDGTTSTVLLIGELLRQAEIYVTNDSVHPRIISDGYDIARDECAKFLSTSTITHSLTFPTAADTDIDSTNNISNPKDLFVKTNREILLSVARTSLQTKINASLVDQMASAVVDAVTTVYQAGTGTDGSNTPIDLNRIELLTLTRRSATDTRFIRGLVLDHGSRHPDMPSILYNCHVMIANISLEYETTETQAGFVYSTADEREKLVESERKWLDERCRTIINFKRSVCGTDSSSSFVIINQKGVDPLSLDIFAKEGILCLRRAKRRNMERLALATGGKPILSLEDLSPDMLGYAGMVSEQSYGDDKYTFIEDVSVSSAQSCTIFVQGPNQLTTEQIKDAIKDGLRAVKNSIEDRALIAGAGAFELAASMYLQQIVIPKTIGKSKIGIAAFAEALLIIPKTLACNSGYDVQEALLQLKDDYNNANPNLIEQMTELYNSTRNDGKNNDDTVDSSSEKKVVVNKKKIIPVGFNCTTGQSMLPEEEGVYDNVRVKRQSLYLSTVLANQLLLVDEVMRAGKQMGRQVSAAQQAAGE